MRGALSKLQTLWQTKPLARDMVMFSSLYIGAELSQQTLLKKVWWKEREERNFYANVEEEEEMNEEEEGLENIVDETDEKAHSKLTFLTKVDHNSDYDWATVGRYAVFGVLVFPVVYNRWYKLLEGRFPGTSKSAVTKKVLLDQFLMEPPLIALFYTGMSKMEGKEDLTSELKAKFIPTFSVGCIYWLPAMALNFLFVPVSARVTFVGVCTFTWCNFICWLKRRNMEDIDPKAEEELVDREV